MIRAVAVVALVFVACATPPQPPSAPASASPSAAQSRASAEFDGARAKAHVDWLADPARGGRYTGSAGYRDAASYVAQQFKEIGLEPLGDNGTYFQHFKMPLVELTAMSALSHTGAPARQYKARVDFTESVGGRSGGGRVEAGLAVVGGAARSNGQNDFAGAGVSGKVALVTGPAMPNGGSSVENAYQEGAAAVLLIGGTTIRYSFISRLQSTTIPTLVITEEVANDLLAPSGKTVSDVRSSVRARRANPAAPPPGFDVATTVRMSVSLAPVQDVDAFNVVGLLRGAEPETSKRAVLIGAHLDGIGTDPDGTVFQAANDNASGAAVAIEVARSLASAKSSLRHSVIFVAFSGEEEGLHGSEAYVTQTATVPGRVESLFAMINLDVVGCCADPLRVSNESPELARRIQEAAARFGVATESIGGSASDQASFLRRRVPAAYVGWSDSILHTYSDVPSIVPASRLKRAGDLLTQVTLELATGG